MRDADKCYEKFDTFSLTRQFSLELHSESREIRIVDRLTVCDSIVTTSLVRQVQMSHDHSPQWSVKANGILCTLNLNTQHKT